MKRPLSLINRREFLITTSLATGGLLAGSCASPGRKSAAGSAARIRWTRNNASRLFTDVACEGRSWVASESVRVLDGTCRLLDEAQAILLNASRPHASAAGQRAPLGRACVEKVSAGAVRRY